MAKINYQQLMELSQERIRPYLPENYEMDDMSCDEEEEIFQISVYDCSQPDFDCKGPADRFRFYRWPGETDEQLMNRWNREFDMDRLYTIAGMAIKGKTPDWHFSDMECHVWSLMHSLIR